MHTIRSFFGLAIFLILTMISMPQALAQSIIRDTEIEEYMAEWFSPIYKAAGMRPEQVKIILVQSPDINAFVAGGANIFFFTGLIQKTDNPGELIGVMAHELGHIAAGHLIRSREAIEQASYESILGSIIGIGAAILTGESEAAAAISTGSTSIAQRRYLAHSRAFESSADQAAIRNMEDAGINPIGFLTFLEKLGSEELLPSNQQSEYVRTHPLTTNRIENVRSKVEKSRHKEKPLPEKWQEQHTRMNAKLLGFINPQRVIWTYDDLDQSIPALYARSIAAYRENKVDEALKKIDLLLEKEPKNPYFHELKGQMLVDFGRVQQGIPHYEKALSIKPDASLIRIALAHAQIETAGSSKKDLIRKAIKNLEIALKSEPRSARIHRLLATAHGRLGNNPETRLHLAEEALLQRRRKYAREQAEIALKGFEEGSHNWLRAQDILNFLDNQKG